MQDLITSIYKLLKQQAASIPDKIAVITASRTLTYAELLSEVDSHALQLHVLGVHRGSCVGIHLRKSIDEIVATFATAALGAIFVNINYQWTEVQVRHIATDCDMGLLITDSRKIRSLTRFLEENPFDHILVVDDKTSSDRIISWLDSPSESPVDFGYAPISNDLAALLYTSGSTGSPKGVMVTHGHLLDGARIVSSYLGLNPSDRILSVPPFNFDYGLNQLLDAFWSGSTIVLQEVPLPAEIARTITRFQITVLPLVAPSWVQLIRLLIEETIEMPTLRIATNTGGKIPGEFLQYVPKLFGGVEFFLMYGLTEAFRSTYLPPVLFQEKIGAIGIAVPDNEIFVVDPKLGLCGPNEVGELLHRGCLVSRGYWNRPDLTFDRTHPNPFLQHLIGDEPVVHSGDLVRMDEDGILWYEGRIDEMIKCSGFRISPTEVEDIAASIPGVVESVAFGVDDLSLGQVVSLAVVTDNATLTPNDVSSFYREKMPAYMIPTHIHLFSQAFPRTATGKLDRPKIIRDCRNRIELDQ